MEIGWIEIAIPRVYRILIEHNDEFEERFLEERFKIERFRITFDELLKSNVTLKLNPRYSKQSFRLKKISPRIDELEGISFQIVYKNFKKKLPLEFETLT